MFRGFELYGQFLRFVPYPLLVGGGHYPDVNLMQGLCKVLVILDSVGKNSVAFSFHFLPLSSTSFPSQNSLRSFVLRGKWGGGGERGVGGGGVTQFLPPDPGGGGCAQYRGVVVLDHCLLYCLDNPYLLVTYLGMGHSY